MSNNILVLSETTSDEILCMLMLMSLSTANQPIKSQYNHFETALMNSMGDVRSSDGSSYH